jgi:uncharacterized protein (UPF0212 family)
MKKCFELGEVEELLNKPGLNLAHLPRNAITLTDHKCPECRAPMVCVYLVCGENKIFLHICKNLYCFVRTCEVKKNYKTDQCIFCERKLGELEDAKKFL